MKYTEPMLYSIMDKFGVKINFELSMEEQLSNLIKHIEGKYPTEFKALKEAGETDEKIIEELSKVINEEQKDFKNTGDGKSSNTIDTDPLNRSEISDDKPQKISDDEPQKDSSKKDKKEEESKPVTNSGSSKATTKNVNFTDTLASKLTDEERASVEQTVSDFWDVWIRNSKEFSIAAYLLDTKVSEKLEAAKTFVVDDSEYIKNFKENYIKKLVQDDSETKKSWDMIIHKMDNKEPFEIRIPKIQNSTILGIIVNSKNGAEEIIPIDKIAAWLITNCGGKLSGSPGASATQVLVKVSKLNTSIVQNDSKTLAYKLPGKGEALKNPSRRRYTAKEVSAKEAELEYGAKTKKHTVRSKLSIKVFNKDGEKRTARVSGSIQVPFYKREQKYIDAGIPAIRIGGNVAPLGTSPSDKNDTIKLVGAAIQTKNAGEKIKEQLKIIFPEDNAATVEGESAESNYA